MTYSSTFLCDDISKIIVPKPQIVNCDTSTLNLTEIESVIYDVGITNINTTLSILNNSYNLSFGNFLNSSMNLSSINSKKGIVLLFKNNTYFQDNLLSIIDYEAVIKDNGFNQEYSMFTHNGSIYIISNSSVGLYYGAQSLRFIFESANDTIEYFKMYDWPDYRVRSYYAVGHEQPDIYDKQYGLNLLENVSRYKFNSVHFSSGSMQGHIDTLFKHYFNYSFKHFMKPLLAPNTGQDYEKGIEGFYSGKHKFIFNSTDYAVPEYNLDTSFMNLDFESGTLGTKPDVWYQGVYAGEPLWLLSDEGCATGKCARVERNISSVRFPMISHEFDVNDSSSFHVEFNIKSENTTGSGYLQTLVYAKNGSQNLGYKQIQTRRDTGGWKKVSVFMPYINGTNRIWIWVRPLDIYGNFTIDDLKITKTSTALSNVLLEGDHEFQITSLDESIIYQNGTDYTLEVVKRDEFSYTNLKNNEIDINNVYVKRLPSGRIPENGEVLISYDHLSIQDKSTRHNKNAVTDYAYDKIRVFYDDLLTKIENAGFNKSDFDLFFGQDEIRGINMDSRSKRAGIDNYEFIGMNFNKLYKLGKELIPEAKIYFWGDMVNYYRNGGFDEYQWSFGGKYGASYYALDLIEDKEDMIFIPWDYCNEDKRLIMRESRNYFPHYNVTYAVGFGAEPEHVKLWSQMDHGRTEYIHAHSIFTECGTLPPKDMAALYMGNYSWNSYKGEIALVTKDNEFEVCNNIDDDGDGLIDEDYKNLTFYSGNLVNRNIMNNPFHCGACDNVCDFDNALESCVLGTCQIKKCQRDYYDRNGDLSDGCEYFQKTLFVNCDSGDDKNWGIDESAPFKTIRRSLEEKNKIGDEDVLIKIRGSCNLNDTLYLTEDHSNLKIVGGENTTVVGGIKTKPDFNITENIYVINMSDYAGDIKQIFVGEERFYKARYPNKDLDSPLHSGFILAKNNGSEDKMRHIKFDNQTHDFITLFENNPDAEVDIYSGPSYWNKIIPVSSVYDDIINLSGNVFYEVRNGNRYYVQNLFTELDNHGEFYYNKTSRLLYFYYNETRSKKSLELEYVYVPTVTDIFNLRHTDNFTINNITIHTSNNEALDIHHSEHINIDDVTIKNVHGMGILVYKTYDFNVSNSYFTKIGDTAVEVMTYDFHNYTKVNIKNNLMHDFGQIFAAKGIHFYAAGAVVSNNTIYNGPRIGISYRGSENIIEYNHLFNLSRKTEDTGGIYQLGRIWLQRGNIIRNNYVHDIYGYGYHSGKWHYPSSARGIYLDDFTSGTLVENNIVINTSTTCVQIHSGRDNKLYNNTFANCGKWGVMFQEIDPSKSTIVDMYDDFIERKDQFIHKYPELNSIHEGMSHNELMVENEVVGNTFYGGEKDQTNYYFEYYLNPNRTIIENNTYWSRSESVSFSGLTLENWQNKGYDLNSINVNDIFNYSNSKSIDIGNPNLISNGDFDDNLITWSVWPGNNVIRNIVNFTQKVTCDYNHTSCLTHGDRFPLEKGKYYMVEFDYKSNVSVPFIVRRSGPTYESIGLSKYITTSKDFIHHSYVFEANTDLTNARIDFESKSGQTYYVDNVSIKEVQVLVPKHYNGSSTIYNVNKTSILYSDIEGKCDINGDKINQSVQVEPYETLIAISCECNYDFVCNNYENYIDCPSDCDRPDISKEYNQKLDELKSESVGKYLLNSDFYKYFNNDSKNITIRYDDLRLKKSMSVKYSFNESLLGWWNFDNVTGNSTYDVKDKSGNNNHGVLGLSVNTTDSEDPFYDAGLVGNALCFDNTIQNFRVESLYGSDLGGQFPSDGTLEFYMYANMTGSSSRGMFDTYDSNRNHIFFRQYYRDPFTQTMVQNGSNYVTGYNIAIPELEWTHITLTWNLSDSRKFKVYRNTDLMFSGDIDDPDYNFSGQRFLFGNGFSGCIDEVRLFNKTLSELEVFENIKSNYVNKGRVVTKEISPNVLKEWKYIFINKTETKNSNVSLSVEYLNGSIWSLVPDNILEKNSIGIFDTVVNISSLNSKEFDRIRFILNFESDHLKESSIIHDLRLIYTTNLKNLGKYRTYLSEDRVKFLRNKTKYKYPYKNFFDGSRASAKGYAIEGPPSKAWFESKDTNYIRKYGNQLSMMSFVGLIENNDSMINASLRLMDRLVTFDNWDKNTDLGPTHILLGMSVTLDWLENNISRERKIDYTKKMIKHLKILNSCIFEEDICNPGYWWNDAYLQNHNHMNNMAIAYVSIVLYEDLDNAEFYFDNAYDNFGFVLDSLSPDGSGMEGIPYWTYSMKDFADYFDLEKRVVGSSRIKNSSWFRNTLDFRYYSSNPNFAFISTFGDGPVIDVYSNPVSHDWYGPFYYLHFLAKEFNNTRANYLSDRVYQSQVKEGIARYNWRDLVWYDENLGFKDPSDMPLEKYFPDLGIISSRSSWFNQNATYFMFKSGPTNGFHAQSHLGNAVGGVGHVHPDSGSYQLFHNGQSLIVDIGYSYQYTKSHNIVTFNDDIGQLGEGNQWFKESEVKLLNASSEIVNLSFGRFHEFARTNLTGIYKKELNITKYFRSIAFLNKRDILVLDDIKSEKELNISSNIHAPFNGTAFRINNTVYYHSYDDPTIGFKVTNLSSFIFNVTNYTAPIGDTANSKSKRIKAVVNDTNKTKIIYLVQPFDSGSSNLTKYQVRSFNGSRLRLRYEDIVYLFDFDKGFSRSYKIPKIVEDKKVKLNVNLTLLANKSVDNESSLVIENLTLSSDEVIIKYDNITITDDINLTRDINFKENFVSINSSALKDFNKSARITFKNVDLKNPQVYRNGVICKIDQCNNFSFVGDEYSFDVASFSTYYLEEKKANISSGGSSGGSSYYIPVNPNFDDNKTIVPNITSDSDNDIESKTSADHITGNISDEDNNLYKENSSDYSGDYSHDKVNENKLKAGIKDFEKTRSRLNYISFNGFVWFMLLVVCIALLIYTHNVVALQKRKSMKKKLVQKLLLKYVKNMLNNGNSISDIVNIFSKRGWPTSLVDEAISSCLKNNH